MQMFCISWHPFSQFETFWLPGQSIRAHLQHVWHFWCVGAGFTLAIVLDISVCIWKLFDDGPVALGCSNCRSMSIAFISLVVILDNYRRYNMGWWCNRIPIDEGQVQGCSGSCVTALFAATVVWDESERAVSLPSLRRDGVGGTDEPGPHNKAQGDWREQPSSREGIPETS